MKRRPKQGSTKTVIAQPQPRYIPEKFPWMACEMPVARCKVMLYRNMAAYEKVSKVGLQELATALTTQVQT